MGRLLQAGPSGWSGLHESNDAAPGVDFRPRVSVVLGRRSPVPTHTTAQGWIGSQVPEMCAAPAMIASLKGSNRVFQHQVHSIEQIGRAVLENGDHVVPHTCIKRSIWGLTRV